MTDFYEMMTDDEKGEYLLKKEKEEEKEKREKAIFTGVLFGGLIFLILFAVSLGFGKPIVGLEIGLPVGVVAALMFGFADYVM